jgi:hypothetical protein
MGILARSEGGTWASDRHPHEPKIKRQLASNGACFICELMEETRVAEQRLRGAVDLLRKLAEHDSKGDRVRAAAAFYGFKQQATQLLARLGGQPSPAGCPACSPDPKTARPPRTCSGEQS